jgi:hypothetical protein
MPVSCRWLVGHAGGTIGAAIMLISQIKALVEGIRLEIASIHEQIRAARDATQASQKAHEEIPVRLAELRVPADERIRADAYRKNAHRQQVLLTWCTGLAFIAAAIYAGIAIKQLTQMKLATQASRKAAYAACVNAQIAKETLRQIQLSNIDTHQAAMSSANQAATAIESEAGHLFILRTPTITPEPGKAIGLPLTIKNSGRSPAVDVRMRVESAFLKMGTEPDFQFAVKPLNHEETGYILPDDPPTTITFKVYEDGKQVAWDVPRIEALKAGAIYLSNYGRITYKDSFGRPHWFQFCVHIDRNNESEQGNFKKCAAYNRLDTTSLEAPLPGNSQSDSTLENIVCEVPKDE